MAHRTGTSGPRRFWLLFVPCALTLGLGATAIPGVGEDLSGVITYDGSRVRVSDSAPILIYLVAFTPNFQQVDIASVSENGGSFLLHAPSAGQYGLLYSIDTHNYRDDSVSVGAPFEVYDNCYQLTLERPPCSELITVPQTGVILEFDDTAILSGIAGTVTYTGIQHNPRRGPVVQAYDDPTFSGEPERGYEYAQTNGRYELVGPAPGTSYYLRAFVDLNSNRQLDPGEPFGACSNAVVAGPDQTNVAITFDDDGAATCIVPSLPTVTPTETPPPTPSPTRTLSPTLTRTPTPTPTVTPTRTRTLSPPLTLTPSATSTPTVTPTRQVTFPGDANCNNRPDVDDVTATETALFDPIARALCDADCNQDDAVTAADMTCVVKLLAGPLSARRPTIMRAGKIRS